MIVAKFGGTSMGSAEAMKKSASIILANPNIRLVVVSATSGTTNELIKLVDLFSHYDPFEKAKLIDQHIEMLINKHLTLCHDLNLSNLENPIRELFLEAKVVGKILTKGMEEQTGQFKKQVDRILSIGERTSSLIFSTYIKTLEPSFNHFDVRLVLKTNANYNEALPLYDLIQDEVNKVLKPKLLKEKLITEGFVGSTIHGNTTTLGRGGSDFTAAILGSALRAYSIQIWTDVRGLFTIDPKIEPHAGLISEISFEECFEVCHFGAKVLHPKTILPAALKNIPVEILSTFEPGSGGTKICPRTELPTNSQPPIRAVTLRKHQTLLKLKNFPKNQLAKIFNLLEHYKTPIDLINTSEVNMAVTIDESLNRVELNSVMLDDLRDLCEVEIDKNLTLVGIIGHDFSQLNLPIHHLKLINYGASPYSLCFLTDETSALTLAVALHREFIAKGSGEA